jgi:hypothetical protein
MAFGQRLCVMVRKTRTKLASRLRTTDESTPPDMATCTACQLFILQMGEGVPLSPDPRPRSSRVGINAARSAGRGLVVYRRPTTPEFRLPSRHPSRRVALPVDISSIVPGIHYR